MSTFLAMSVSGGALILIIAVLRALFAQRLPRRLLCALWAAALLRLLLPVFPPSPLSLLPAVESGGGEALPAIAAAPTAAPQTVVSTVAPDAQVAASEAVPAATRAAAMPQTALAPQAVAPANAESPRRPSGPSFTVRWRRCCSSSPLPSTRAACAASAPPRPARMNTPASGSPVIPCAARCACASAPPSMRR